MGQLILGMLADVIVLVAQLPDQAVNPLGRGRRLAGGSRGRTRCDRFPLVTAGRRHRNPDQQSDRQADEHQCVGPK